MSDAGKMPLEVKDFGLFGKAIGVIALLGNHTPEESPMLLWILNLTFLFLLPGATA